MLQFDVLIKSLAVQGAEICRFFKRQLTRNTLSPPSPNPPTSIVIIDVTKYFLEFVRNMDYGVLSVCYSISVRLSLSLSLSTWDCREQNETF